MRRKNQRKTSTVNSGSFFHKKIIKEVLLLLKMSDGLLFQR
jgi:hypothetical protein